MRQLKITPSVTDRSSKSIEKYFNDISKIPLLDSQREIELAPKIRAGDEAALQELVNANLRFVVSCAKQYQNRGVALPDLINEGNLGLIIAAKRFDETRGFKFISYAVWWIRQSLLLSVAESSRLIRLPGNKIGLQNKFLKEQSKLEQELGREPSNEEIMESMDISNKQMFELLETMNRVQSFDANLTNDEGSLTLIDVLKPFDGDTNSPDEPLMFTESIQIDIERTLSTLTPNEREIVEMFFGLKGKRQMSLDEIASVQDCTSERIRQIKEKSVRKLRRYSCSTILKKYLN
jgi:RNA polymerase primary sigma factor